MEARKLIEILKTAERLKDTARHCYTSKGRRESVAEHSWMMTLMAFFMRDEFPDADMDKVAAMCVIHDLGGSLYRRYTSLRKDGGRRGEGGETSQRMGFFPARSIRRKNEVSL